MRQPLPKQSLEWRDALKWELIRDAETAVGPASPMLEMMVRFADHFSKAERTRLLRDDGRRRPRHAAPGDSPSGARDLGLARLAEDAIIPRPGDLRVVGLTYGEPLTARWSRNIAGSLLIEPADRVDIVRVMATSLGGIRAPDKLRDRLRRLHGRPPSCRPRRRSFQSRLARCSRRANADRDRELGRLSAIADRRDPKSPRQTCRARLTPTSDPVDDIHYLIAAPA